MEWNISTIVGGATLLLLIVVGWMSYTAEKKPDMPEIPRFYWNIATGKERSFGSMTGDASLATETLRRKTINQIGKLDKSKIKESRTSTGSTTGALETYFITFYCPPIINYLFDAGGATDEYCEVLDDSNAYNEYDAGGATTKVCE